MKRLISAVLAVLMLTVLLTACGGGNKLSGSYKASGMLTETTYTFAKDERLGEAAWPCLAIVLVSVVPVLLLSKVLAARRGAR